MPSVSDDEANVVLLCKCKASFDMLGGGDIDGVINIVAQLTRGRRWREGIAALVRIERSHH